MENQHVTDLQTSIAKLKGDAKSLEKTMKSTTYASKEACEANATAEMTAFVEEGLENAILSTQSKRDRPQHHPDFSESRMDQFVFHNCKNATERGYK